MKIGMLSHNYEKKNPNYESFLTDKLIMNYESKLWDSHCWLSRSVTYLINMTYVIIIYFFAIIITSYHIIMTWCVIIL